MTGAAASGLRADLAARDSAVRTRALLTLLGDPEAAKRFVPDVGDRLLDPDFGLRRTAVLVLSRTGRPGVEPLIRALSPRQPVPVRVQAAGALAEIGPDAEEAVPALLACLFAADDDVRGQAAWALGQIGEASVGSLTELLPATEDAAARSAACDALGWVGPQARPAIGILKALLRAENASVRSAALSAVSRIRGRPGRHMQRLLELSRDEDPSVRRGALARVGEQRAEGRTALPRVLEMLGDADADVRAEAAYVLARIEADPTEHTGAVLPLLRDGRATVRCAAGACLHAFGPPAESAVPRLESRYSDPDPRVAEVARAAVRRIRGEK